ncbi:MAG TPA: hypothetical protein VL769_05880 [Acidimicrobiia bacterium]|jgi:hypothetical protein|nr:hypothetical protein [Acidimicrobiia bacterium]
MVDARLSSRWARLALEALIVVVVFAATEGLLYLISGDVASAFSYFAFVVGLTAARMLSKRWPPLDDERQRTRLS